ncbi:MAG: hypothetical protein ACI4NM_02015 [Bullifex sp.]
MKKCITMILMLVLVLTSVFAQGAMESEKIPVKVLILPKFEIGDITGDFPGEAQYYYDAYVKGGDEYEIKGGFEGNPLYVKDGVALYVTGMGKVNSALSLQAVLSDDRFDFSECYFFSTGCAGSATGYTVMGDVFVITACADFDLGHHADNREMADQDATTWFHDEGYDSSAFKLLNQELTDKVYELVKDTEISTTEKTRRVMALTFDNAEWAVRDPKVQKGTTVSGDNYWKGAYDEANARLICVTYGAPDPYALTEMEDVALAVVLDRYGYLDKYIIIRDSVNMDVFLYGTNPENLWSMDDSLASDESVESADVFATARKNNFLVGSRIVDAIISGNL